MGKAFKKRNIQCFSHTLNMIRHVNQWKERTNLKTPCNSRQRLAKTRSMLPIWSNTPRCLPRPSATAPLRCGNKCKYMRPHRVHMVLTFPCTRSSAYQSLQILEGNHAHEQTKFVRMLGIDRKSHCHQHGLNAAHAHAHPHPLPVRPVQ